MAAHELKLADLNRLSEAEVRQRAVEFSSQRQMLNGERAQIDRQIHRFEKQYEMSSDELPGRLKNGSVKETFDICEWLMLLKIRTSFDTPQR